MKKWCLLSLLPLLSLALTAQAAQHAELGCQRLRIDLDPALTEETVEREWQSGEPRQERPASLQWVGCDGQVLSQLPLAAPLARLDPRPLRGAPHPTFLVSADLTQEAGSYNGPLTTAVEVVSNRLQVVRARPASGKGQSVPLQLTQTLKSSWKRVDDGQAEALLAVRSQPSQGRFTTTFSRYDVSRGGWRVSARTQAGLWESDGDFPADTAFPAPLGPTTPARAARSAAADR